MLKQNENHCSSVNVSGKVLDEFWKFQLSVCVNYVLLTPVEMYVSLNTNSYIEKYFFCDIDVLRHESM